MCSWYIGMSDASSLARLRNICHATDPRLVLVYVFADYLCSQIAVREGKRQNAAYRLHAIPALGRVAAARTDKDMSDTVYDVIAPVLDETVEKEEADDDAMDVDGASNDTASR